MFNIDRFNEQLAGKLADGMTTMKCAWLIVILISIPLFVHAPQNILEWQQWLVCSLFQGAGLSILGYSGKKDGKETRDLLQKIYDSIFEELKVIKEMMQKIIEIQKDIEEEKTELDEILKEVKDDGQK